MPLPSLRLECFDIGAVLGRGGFGIVYDAVSRYDGKRVALKEISGKAPPRRVEAELQALQSASHRHIVAFYGTFTESGKTYIVMECCAYGSIAMWVKKHGKIYEDMGAQVLRQLAAAVTHLHTRLQLMHRDISAGNVLISEIDTSSRKIKIKLGDFGLATVVDQRAQKVPCTVAGTPGYMAPQVMADGPYSKEADIFSMGAVLYTALTAADPPRPKFPNDDIRPQLSVSHLTQSAIDLLYRMLEPKAELRCPLRQIYSSEFLRMYGQSGRSVDNGSNSLRSLDQQSNYRSSGKSGGTDPDHHSPQYHNARHPLRAAALRPPRLPSQERGAASESGLGGSLIDDPRRPASAMSSAIVGTSRGVSQLSAFLRGPPTEHYAPSTLPTPRHALQPLNTTPVAWPLATHEMHFFASMRVIRRGCRLVVMSATRLWFEYCETPKSNVRLVLDVNLADTARSQRVTIRYPASPNFTLPTEKAELIAVAPTGHVHVDSFNAFDPSSRAAYEVLASVHMPTLRERCHSIAWQYTPGLPGATTKLMLDGAVRILIPPGSSGTQHTHTIRQQHPKAEFEVQEQPQGRWELLKDERLWAARRAAERLRRLAADWPWIDMPGPVIFRCGANAVSTPTTTTATQQLPAAATTTQRRAQ